MKPCYQTRARLRSAHVISLAFTLWLHVIAVGQTIIVDPPIVVPLSTLTVSDIDFMNSTSPKLLFTISMRTSDGSTVDAKMTISLDIFLSTGETFNRAIFIQTKPPHFAIPGMRTITNLDLGKSIPIEKAEVDQAARQRLEEISLPSGVVPSGTYDFLVDVAPLDGSVPPPQQKFKIVLSNPSSIELLLPTNGEQLMTTFPLFQWRYEGNARLSVFEKLDAQGSLEEAASGVPLLIAESSTQSYQYPTAGARSLMPGRTYVWYVEGLAPTSGGTELVQKSTLRWFTATSEGAATATGTQAAGPSLLDELERALGPKYRPLFDQIRAQGLLPDSVFRLNDRLITYTELMKVLEQFRANPDAVTSVELQ